MSITYKINEQYNGIEIHFSEKPSKEVLAKLKELGFRWHPHKCVWYAKNTDERLAFAKSIEDKSTYEQISLFTEDKAEDKAEEKDEPKAEETTEEVKEEAKVDEVTKAKTTNKTKKATKTTTKAKPQADETKDKAKDKKDNIIEFAKARPKVNVRMAIDEVATIEDCIAKINSEKAIYKDSSSHYVLEGLLKMCEVNPNFRANFMRADKTYGGAFKYFSNLAKNGYAHKVNGVCYLDDDLALGMAMDYFNSID